MSFSFGLFLDSALTQPANVVTLTEDITTGTPTDKHLYFGSTATGTKCQANSNPGTDQITISLTDSTPGAGHPTTDIKLALTQVGLDAAAAGAALNLGSTVNSGTANAVSVWLRFTDSTGVVAIRAILAEILNRTQDDCRCRYRTRAHRTRHPTLENRPGFRCGTGLR